MFRLFKKYNVSAPYDGISPSEASTHLLDLDPVEVAGQLRVRELAARMQQRQLGFVDSVNIIIVLGVFLSLLIGQEAAPYPM